MDAAAEAGDSRRRRWDSLRPFTPSQYANLPGLAFPADHDQYRGRDDVADYLHGYVTAFGLPIRLNTPITALTRTADGRYLAEAGDHVFEARQVVIATGPLQVPFIPPVAGTPDPGVFQLHSNDYRKPRCPAARAGPGGPRWQLWMPDSRGALVHP